jgi:hypothetical protein
MDLEARRSRVGGGIPPAAEEDLPEGMDLLKMY